MQPMKSVWIGLMAIAGFVAAPAASADSEIAIISTPDDPVVDPGWIVIGIEPGVLGKVKAPRNVPVCVDTNATCGPYGNAWVAVYAEANTSVGYVRVCATSNTANILC
ncbi:MAG TPA: hypothetical protein VI997_06370 [Candidatus Thermoplasmatota archaeon]|nr:hypothetical protein [Candidatus Thermoplasmatota archaeon]